ncbi:hypothetical protein BC827DRAFT_315626 [Russula dissimulans]|nr:hypothetical protein BC827DRAFT_315626 [Russula dissimulans]
MGRWTQYDEDSYRLPEGMRRVGYDADSGRYYFSDVRGGAWEGQPHAYYGEMRRVSNSSTATTTTTTSMATESSDGAEGKSRRWNGFALLLARWGTLRRGRRTKEGSE